MFGERIMSTPLCDLEANEFFDQIQSTGLTGFAWYDETFISTLRYLLYSRIKDNESVLLKYSAGNVGLFCFPKNTYFNKNATNGNIVIINAKVSLNEFMSSDNSYKCLVREEYREQRDLSLFIKNKCHVEPLIFINKRLKNTVIFINGLTLKVWHLLQSLIPRLVPWYFEETPLTEDEKKFLYTLSTNPDADAYKKCLYDFATKLNLRDSRIKRLLKDFESKRKEKEIGELELQIISFRNEIDRILEKYKHLIHDIEDAATRKDGLKFQLENSKDMNSELINYLTCNKHVNLHRVTDETFEIGVTTTLENYDPDLYDRMSKNRNSAIFKCYPVSEITFSEEETRKRFLDAIFGDDPVLKIKIKAGFELNFVVKSVDAIEQPVEYEDGYLYNPHLKIHHCIGNNRPEINQCLINSDYVGAIEQCIASAKNMNFAEGSITVSPFFRWLFDKNCEKVILMPDGTSKTPKEAYEWLLNEEVK